MDRVLFEVTFNYLKELEKPHEAINEKTWKYLVNLFWNDLKTPDNKEIVDFIASKRLNEIAPFVGVLWHNKKDETLKETLQSRFSDIKKKYVGEWRTKGIVLILASLLNRSDEQLYDLANKLHTPSKYEQRLANCDYDRIRIDVTQYLTKYKDEINDDTFNDIIKDFMKTVAKTLLRNGNFSDKIDKKNYLQCFFKRFYEMKLFDEISEELDTYPGQLNNIVNKFIEEFNTAFEDVDDQKVLCKKFENFYDKAFYNLNDSDLKERNRKLDILKRFQVYFIAENLADYIE